VVDRKLKTTCDKGYRIYYAIDFEWRIIIYTMNINFFIEGLKEAKMEMCIGFFTGKYGLR
jgi:hypothetical protein